MYAIKSSRSIGPDLQEYAPHYLDNLPDDAEFYYTDDPNDPAVRKFDTYDEAEDYRLKMTQYVNLYYNKFALIPVSYTVEEVD